MMLIIIDAYNVLKQTLPSRDISDRKRTKFIMQMAAYAKLRKHTVVVVFDGGPYHWPSRGHEHGILVIYSGARQTADKVIQDYVQENKNKKPLLVSSDRELCAWVSQEGVISIGSLEFCNIVENRMAAVKEKKTSRQKGTVVKLSSDENEEVDKLMTEGSMYVDQKDDLHDIQLDEDTHKLSKDERKMADIIRKL